MWLVITTMNNLLLTNTLVSRLCKTFANNSSVTKKLSKTHLSKIRRSEGLVCRILGPLLKIYLLLMTNVLKVFTNINSADVKIGAVNIGPMRL